MPLRRLLQQPLAGAGLLLSLLLTAELAAILWLNNGHFLFTLDDPYIHLALAENLLHGHYGVNLQEYSAPSSSILWPLLIAPLTLIGDGALALLALNSLLALLSLQVADRLLDQLPQPPVASQRFWLLAGFVLVANLAGLAYTGMEHNLQVLLAMLIVYGMVLVAQGKQPPALLWSAIVLAPLVRYECLALSGAALLFLFVQGHYRQSLLAGTLIAVLLGLFSLLLLSLGLDYLPDSVLTKSGVAASGLAKLQHNLQRNFLPPATLKAMALLLALLLLAAAAINHRLPRPARHGSAVLALAIVLQLLAGRIGWYFRYEIFLWAAVISWLLWLQAGRDTAKPVRALLWLMLAISLLEHLAAAITTPLASANVYHQQYQMQRFLRDYYRQPVAVNDLGLTSYRNDQYVLDLWGLGSGEARRLRASAVDPGWMDSLLHKHQVQLAMIYHHPVWFASVPDNWIKLGELQHSGPKITARFPVSFYTPCRQCVPALQQQLAAFSATLPAQVRYTAQ